MRPDDEEWMPLYDRANEDYKGFPALVQMPDIALPISCYLAEQAVEKFLKAVPSKKGISFPFTHDLTELGVLCADYRINFPVEISDLEKFNPSMLKQRYDLPPKLAVTREELKKLVDLVAHWCKEQLHD